MSILVTTGTPRLPQSGVFAMPTPIWPDWHRDRLVQHLPCTRVAGDRSRAGYEVRPRTLFFVNPIGIDLPVTDPMRASATEP